MIRKIQSILLVFLLIGVSMASAQDQNPEWAKAILPDGENLNTSQSKEKKLQPFLEKLEATHDVSFMYESGLLKQLYVSSELKLTDSFGKDFRKLLDAGNLTYSRLNKKTFVLVKDLTKEIKLFNQHMVKGTVTDAQTGDVLPSVNILVKGTSVGTSTDANGDYELMAPNPNDTLVVSFVGYNSKQVSIRGRSNIDISLAPTTVTGEEVTVVAYGEQSTDELTSSVSSVSSEEISKVPVGNVGNALLGKTPGLQTIQTTGLPGGSSPNMFIRGIGSLSAGNSSPIFVIDGVKMQNASAFGDLNSNNIESISVLKDASATAVYGVEGANGVVVVETKRGRPGEADISISSSYGFQSPTVTQSFVNSYKYATSYNEAQLTDGVREDNLRFDSEALSAFKNNTYPVVYADVDWQQYLFKERAPRSQTNINLSGGSQDVQYFVSAGFLREDGFFKDFPSESPSVVDFNPSFNRYNVRSNVDVQVTPTTQIAVTASGKIGNRIRARSGSWLDLRASTPYSGPGIVDGRIVTSDRRYVSGRRQNVTPRLFGSGYNENIQNSLNINLSGVQQLDFITDGLEFELKGSYNSYFTQHKYRSKEYAYYQPVFRADVDPAAPEDSSVVYQKNGQDGILNYSEDFSRDRDWYFEASLNYSKQVGSHNFEGLLMYNQREDFYPVSFTSIPRRLTSTVGRVNYNYDQRYLLELSAGYNGSQNFAEGQRFGFFPAGSIGWIVSNESFMENIEFLDFLKLRASYGIVGNDSGIGRFLYLPNSYNSSAGGYNYGINVPQSETGISEGQIGNQSVTWETSKKQNYGIDLRLWDSQLEMSFDYFHELRSDILATRNNVPNFVAADLPAANIGRVKNFGYEAQAKWQQQVGDFYYSIGGNVTFARNEILFMDEVDPPESYMQRTGQSVGQQFGFLFDGYYTQDEINNIGNGVAEPTWEVKPGFLKWKDVNGDGVINSNDKVPVGYPENSPEFVFGSSLSFGYKGLDLSMTWAAATNVSERLQYSPYQTPFGGDNNYSVMEWQYEGRWTPEKGQNATYPRFSLNQTHQRNDHAADYWMIDASYLRLKNMEIGYSLSNEFLDGNGLGLEGARVYLNGYNLLTFSKMMSDYSIDPEQHATNFSQEYPIMKTYNFGIKLDF